MKIMSIRKNKKVAFNLTLLIFCTSLSLSPSCYSQNQIQQSSRPLRILFVVGIFPALSVTYIISQITDLIDRGHDIFICAKSRGDNDKIHLDIENYQLLKKTSYNRLPSDLDKFDIVYCTSGTMANRFFNLCKCKKIEIAKPKVVTHFHGYDVGVTLKQNNQAYKELFSKGDLFLSACTSFCPMLLKAGCNPQKIIIHPMGINISRFTKKKSKELNPTVIQILSVGRFVEKKGTEYTIRAVAKLLKKNPQIQYSIIGYGPLEKKLRDLIISLETQNNIHIVGEKTEDEIIDLLSKTDILILGSITGKNGDIEARPQTLKEAMAMGVPVVSTYHSGVPEFIEDGVSGFLVAEKDVYAMAEKIELLINNEEKRKEIGMVGKKIIEEKYDNNKLSDRLIEIFCTLLDT